MKSVVRSAAVLTLLLFTLPLFSQSSNGMPSAKSAMDIASLKVISLNNKWVDVARTAIKMPAKKDLFMDISLQCGLFRDGSTATPIDDANVKVRVLVDGVEAHTGRVIYCRKTQSLAPFPGLASCTAASGERFFSSCSMSASERTSALRSVVGADFQYVLLNVGVGIHNIKVQALIDPGTSPDGAPNRAVIGKGPATVEDVRLINSQQ
jgi:hypothetical protein